MSDPAIEEIERSIRKSRFEESDIEKRIGRMAERKMAETSLAQHKDRRAKDAFIAGFKSGHQNRSINWKHTAVTVYLTLVAVTCAAALVIY